MLSAAATMALVLMAMPIGIRIAQRFGLVDSPGGRKQHEGSTPLVGGLVMTLSLLCVLGLTRPPAEYTGLILPLCLILALGLVDDCIALRARYTFFLQAAIALVLIYHAGVAVSSLGNLLGTGELTTQRWAILFTVISTVGMTNAINMVDGADGLAGGIVALSLAWLMLLAYLTGDGALLRFSAMMEGALVGFLAYNLRTPWRGRAAVFMGNAGSMSLGLVMTFLSVRLTGEPGAAVRPMTAVWVMGLPLMDMARVMARRMAMGRSPFDADRLHLHHLLMRMGMSHGVSVHTKLLLSFVLGGVGVLGWWSGVPEWVMFWGFLLTLGVYCILLGHRFDARYPGR